MNIPRVRISKWISSQVTIQALLFSRQFNVICPWRFIKFGSARQSAKSNHLRCLDVFDLVKSNILCIERTCEHRDNETDKAEVKEAELRKKIKGPLQMPSWKMEKKKVKSPQHGVLPAYHASNCTSDSPNVCQTLDEKWRFPSGMRKEGLKFNHVNQWVKLVQSQQQKCQIVL